MASLFSFLTRPKWSSETQRIMSLMPKQEIFLTGIEGSDPHIDGVRRNQLQEAHDFYTNYEQRLENIRNLGITWLRFGPPYSQVHIANNKYDFQFIDKVLNKCEALGITVMADLLHFGLPDWLHEKHGYDPYFQNPHFPELFATYVKTFAKRYPHIKYYTIVNEPFVTAYLSAKLGLWNEHRASDWDQDFEFVTAVTNIAKAAILGRQAIEAVWQEEKREGEPLFVQNESFEVAKAVKGSGREKEAERFNLRRFAPMDLILGHRNEAMRNYLIEHGLSADSYEWFMKHGRSDKTILGIDHYPTCVHTFSKDGTKDGPISSYQLYELTKIYWKRYPLPLLHTEVNAWPEYAVRVCRETYEDLSRLKREGYPILGMGWYGDDLQVGWHVAMRGPKGMEETPVGLFYKGQPQPVAVLFKQLSQQGLGGRVPKTAPATSPLTVPPPATTQPT